MGRSRLLVAVVAVLAAPLLSGSSEAASQDTVPGSDPAALALLRAAVRAEGSVSYDGLETVSDRDGPVADDARGPAADHDEVVELRHVAGRGTVVVTRTPGSSADRAGFRDEDVRRPDLLVALLQRSFRIVLDGSGVVAGRPADVVAAVRVDGSVAARFFVDRATGLLLRRDVVDGRGRTASSEAFERLSLRAEAVTTLPPRLPSVRTASLDGGQLGRWRARGWPCPDRLGGLSLFDARTVTGSGADVLHVTYSDGLSTVSVFVQPGRLDPAAPAGASDVTVGGERVRLRPGHPQQLTWSADGVVLTVVADAPADVVHAVVSALPHEHAASGLARVARGLSRVVSWVNPFD